MVGMTDLTEAVARALCGRGKTWECHCADVCELYGPAATAALNAIRDAGYEIVPNRAAPAGHYRAVGLD
jgi:hypothetical protein